MMATTVQVEECYGDVHSIEVSTERDEITFVAIEVGADLIQDGAILFSPDEADALADALKVHAAEARKMS